MINTILQGHVLEKLKEIPDEFVDCVVTSPPFWALRNYQTEHQIWDGDRNCEHQWSFQSEQPGDIRFRHGHNTTVGNYNNPEIYGIKVLKHKANETNQGLEAWYKEKLPIEIPSSFCSKCGAWKGSLGLEPTFELYIKHLCDIFDEVKRVLKKTGTCFVDLGDTYAGSSNGTNDYRTEASKSLSGKRFDYNMMFQGKQRKLSYPSKSLCLIPYRFAIEMASRGWICRNVIIWHKPNCMPASVKDRFTVDFEPIFFFTKSRHYYFEQQFEPHLIQENRPDGIVRQRTFGYDSKYLKEFIRPFFNQRVKDVSLGKIKSHQYRASEKKIAEYKKRKMVGTNYSGNGKGLYAHSGYYDYDGTPRFYPQGRNKRTVWTIPTRPFLGAHFAVFPSALVEPMIQAGCPEFICKKCEVARQKIFKVEIKSSRYNRGNKSIHFRIKQDVDYKRIDRGYSDCGCGEGFKAGLVLDPFFGSGTTAIVARKLNRNWVGIELKSDYCELARKRIEQEAPMTLFEVEIKKP